MEDKPRPSGIWRAWKAESNAKRKQRLLGELMAAHEGFTRLIVRRIRSQQRVLCPLEDMMQAARVGLLVAINKWDPARGRFTTCAWWWIRHEIQQAITKDLPVRRQKGALTPVRVTMETALEGLTPAPDDDRQSDLGVARELLEEMSDEERALVFGPECKQREELVRQLREILEDE